MKKWFYFLFLFIGFISCKENTNTKAQKDSLSGDRVLIIDSAEGNIVVESENATAKKLFKQTCNFGDVKINIEEKDQKLFINSNCKVVEDFTVDLDSKLEAIIETDVNSDGFNEFYCVTKTGNLIAYASYKNKSFGEIYIPKKPLDFYSDFNELKLWEVKKNHLILTFSNGGNNQINVVRYALKSGETSFILEAK